MTKQQFLNLPAAKQIEAYDTWLDLYKFKNQMTDHGVEVLALPLARQAAVLQAMQFAPNAKRWKSALSKGNLSVPSTASKQAKVLGDTSIGDMEEYYAKFFRRRPPVYA